jgi:CheY-like chemotaxis protein
LNRTGKVIGASKIARDITAQKMAARELALVHAKAVEANRVKDVFLAKLSHELRTPLNPVLLVASEAATDTTLSQKVRRDFETIRKGVELEARLVDDLLDLAKVTRGKLQLELGRYDLRKILAEALMLVEGEAREKNLLLRTDLPDRAVSMVADAVRLQQVCWNLLKNAVKFTPSGGVVTVTLRPDPAREMSCITVSDTGRGIAPQEAAFIFDPFMQGGATGIGSAKGLGLGLTIARQIVELHGGAIHASSAGLGCGATFTVELPTARDAGLPMADPPASESAGVARDARKLTILVIEDHEPSQRALQRLLSNRGHTVAAVRSAAEARQAVQRERYDLAIVDLGLPDGNGAELIGEFHSGVGPRCIALSGYGSKEDVEQCFAAGALAHLTKTVSIQALDKTLSEFGAAP